MAVARGDIGEYRIIRLLGEGGMSEVYEAEHRRLGSRHAIKLFTYDKDVDGVRDRFLVEGRLLARLAHPRIVRVTDAGTDVETGRPYFVMDLIVDPDGAVRSLADVPDGGAEEPQIAMWYDDLREGLAYIHAKGIVHRDLKLENVLIGPDGHVVLTDFGISKIVKPDGGGEAVVDPVKTIVRLKDGKRPVMGSLGYMAPELEMGVAASPQSDYYALGVIVFRLLTGVWCDSRTDVVATLDTYDPVWMQILPKLLHSNPRGRECPSWQELKAAATERQIMDAEQVSEECRANETAAKRRVLWAVSTASVICVAAAIAVAALVARQKRVVQTEAAPMVTFEDVVFVPDDAPKADAEDNEDADDHASRDQLLVALPAAWVLVHDVFSDLRKGKITREKAIEEISKFAELAENENENDDPNLFGGPHEYFQHYVESSAIAELLRAAAERMKGDVR